MSCGVDGGRVSRSAAIAAGLHRDVECGVLPLVAAERRESRRGRASGRGRALTYSEREEISRGSPGRSPARISRSWGEPRRRWSREVRRHGGRGDYRAPRRSPGMGRARRPKRCRLPVGPRLRAAVARKLACQWSPSRSPAGFAHVSDDAEMHVSHETIYRSLFVQSRGVLKRALLQHLRRRRACGSPRRATRQGHHAARLPTRFRSVSGRPGRGTARSPATGRATC